MSRSALFAFSTVLWLVLAALQFVQDAPVIGGLFVVVAVLNLTAFLWERRRGAPGDG